MDLDIESNWLDYIVHCFYQTVTIVALSYIGFCVFIIRKYGPKVEKGSEIKEKGPEIGGKNVVNEKVAAAVADFQSLADEDDEQQAPELAPSTAPVPAPRMAPAPAPRSAPAPAPAPRTAPRPEPVTSTDAKQSAAVTVDQAMHELMDVAEQARTRVYTVPTLEENLLTLYDVRDRPEKDTRPVVAVKPHLRAVNKPEFVSDLIEEKHNLDAASAPGSQFDNFQSAQIESAQMSRISNGWHKSEGGGVNMPLESESQLLTQLGARKEPIAQLPPNAPAPPIPSNTSQPPAAPESKLGTSNRIRYMDSESDEEEEEEEDEEMAQIDARHHHHQQVKVTAMEQTGGGRQAGRRIVSEVTVQNVTGARSFAAEDKNEHKQVRFCMCKCASPSKITRTNCHSKTFKSDPQSQHKLFGAPHVDFVTDSYASGILPTNSKGAGHFPPPTKSHHYPINQIFRPTPKFYTPQTKPRQARGGI